MTCDQECGEWHFFLTADGYGDAVETTVELLPGAEFALPEDEMVLSFIVHSGPESTVMFLPWDTELGPQLHSLHLSVGTDTIEHITGETWVRLGTALVAVAADLS